MASLSCNFFTLVPCFFLFEEKSHNIKPSPPILSHLLLCWVRSREPVLKSGSAFTFQMVKKVKKSKKEKWNILCCDLIWGSFELYLLMPTIPCQGKDLAKVHLQNCLQIDQKALSYGRKMEINQMTPNSLTAKRSSRQTVYQEVIWPDARAVLRLSLQLMSLLTRSLSMLANFDKRKFFLRHPVLSISVLYIAIIIYR